MSTAARGGASGHPEHFDAIVVGSGFGGSVMAYRLAEAGQRVCVLERGRRYPPGSFARAPREMRANFWDPARGRLGLFQIWKFRHLDAVVAAGLGGGSLIYANVLLRKDARWFSHAGPGASAWPVAREDLETHYDRVEAMLAPERFPFGHPPYDSVAKTRAFREAAGRAGMDWFLPELAIRFSDGAGSPVPGEPIHEATGNLHGRTRTTCRLCGECDLGCNFGSKSTLDFTYLTQAARLGADLRDRCEVHTVIPRPGGGFQVGYVRRGAGPASREIPETAAPIESAAISADRLVLAAGAIGTPALLLRNRARLGDLGPMLGRRCSANGDFLAFAHGARLPGGERRDLAPSHGPVITSSVRVADTRDGGNGPGLYLQEGGYPVFVDWLVEASGVAGLSRRAARYLRRQVERRLGRRSADLGSELVRLLGEAHRSASLLPILGMGVDEADGTLSLRRGRLEHSLDPTRSGAYYDRVAATMRTIATAMGAELSVAPTARTGRTVTVHPLGGCAMGADPSKGVVDRHGQVFSHPGLVVADGSVVPGPVGANPALTIAALADRFAERLM